MGRPQKVAPRVHRAGRFYAFGGAQEQDRSGGERPHLYDAFELLTSIVRRAQKNIALVDGYVDAGTLNVLAKKQDGVEVTAWTHPRTKLTQRDVDTFNAQYPLLTVRHTEAFHDRFLILDGAEGYFVGASLKDAGKKCFAISRIEDASVTEGILARLEA